MDVYDTRSFLENTMHYMHKQDLKFLMHNVYSLILNITIQHIRLRFNNGLSLSFMEFEHDIDNIFDEINAYIPQFTTRSDTPSSNEKRWIFGAAFTVVSGLVSAYRFYKDYVFNKNMTRTLHYILSNQNHFSQNILTNKHNLLSLAEITSSNFKDVHADIFELKSDTNKKFDTNLTQLMHTSADSIFYKNYVLYYVNILHHLDHDLVAHNNRIKRIKSILHLKCKTFISGLHVLTNNRILESILHANVFSNILHGISQYLFKENVYSLLYSSSVQQRILQYEHCREFHYR